MATALKLVEQGGLTIEEQGRLKALEATIEQGLKTFVEVGSALLEIRDGRLSPELQAEAWQQAVETAPGGKVTAAHVAGVAREVQRRDKVAQAAVQPQTLSGSGQALAILGDARLARRQ
ncbi:MAG: hypothetical protein JXA37_11335 [Chloroflexia bacterium]|nr:hypothetical protein [Chloroflexia bacterium]